MLPIQEIDMEIENISRLCFDRDYICFSYNLTFVDDEYERRNDTEEIRRKLAMDSDSEDYYLGERVTRKPSLATRLQNGMNLQICFMNETASDQESPGSDQDTDCSVTNEKKEIASKSLLPESHSALQQVVSTDDIEQQEESSVTTPLVLPENNMNYKDKEVSAESTPSSYTKRQRPSFFFNRQKSWKLRHMHEEQKKDEKKEVEENFFTHHARLQAEARMALAQAKEMARMQIEVERQERKKKSPIVEIVGLPFPDGKHRFSHRLLNSMNVAQLQVIVNDLHSQIEGLNEELVRLLLERDDLHMEQDSMLVDIEDLTRYLGARDEALRNQKNNQLKTTKGSKIY